MKKVSLKTMERLLTEFKDYAELEQESGDDYTKHMSEQDVADITNVIAMLAVRGLIKDDRKKK